MNTPQGGPLENIANYLIIQNTQLSMIYVKEVIQRLNLETKRNSRLHKGIVSRKNYGLHLIFYLSNGANVWKCIIQENFKIMKK